MRLGCFLRWRAAWMLLLAGLMSAAISLALTQHARADDCNLIPSGVKGGALLDLMALSSPDLELLCRTMRPQERESRLPLVPGVLRTLQAFAAIITSDAGVEGLDDRSELDKKLFKALPQKSQDFCKERSPKKDEPLIAACLRPKCLESSDSKYCKGIDLPPSALKIFFAVDSAKCKENISECDLWIDEASVDISIAEEILRPVIERIFSDGAKEFNSARENCQKGNARDVCAQTILGILRDFNAQLSRQQDLALLVEAMIGTDSANKNQFLSSNLPLMKFYDYWKQHVFPLFNSAESRTASGTYSISISAEMLKTSPERARLFNGVDIWLRGEINSRKKAVAAAIVERLSKLDLRKDTFKEIDEKLGEQYNAELRNQLTKLKASMKLEPTKGTEETIRATIERLDTKTELNVRVAEHLPLYELEKAFVSVRQHAATQIEGAKGEETWECKREASIDPTKGFYDFCASGSGSIKGIRYSFGPCANADAECQTVGHLSLIMRVQPTGQPVEKIILVPFGVESLKGVMRKGQLELPKFMAPAYKADASQLATQIEQMLPPPFKIAYENIEIKNGPLIEITVRPSLAIPGIPAWPPLVLTLQQEIPLDLKTVEKAVSSHIASHIAGASIKVGAVKVTADNDGVVLNKECGKKPGSNDTAVKIKGKADLGELLQRLPADVIIDCAGQIRLTVDERRLTEALIAMFPSEIVQAFENVAFDSVYLRFSAQVEPACRQSFSFSLDEKLSLDSINKRVAKAVGRCKTLAEQEAAVARLMDFEPFPFFKWDPQKDNRKACTTKDSPVGRICISSQKDIGELEDITIDDDGVFRARIQGALTPFRPNIEKFVFDDKKKQFVLVTQISVPGLGQSIPVSVPLKEWSEATLKNEVRQVAAVDVNERLQKMGSLNVGPVTLRNPEFKSEEKRGTISGFVTYGRIASAKVEIELWPDFKIKPESPKIEQLLPIALAAAGFAGVDDPIVGVARDGVPFVHAPIKGKLPLFGGSTVDVTTTIHARANEGVHIEAITIPIPGWFPIATGLEIGRTQIEVDLEHPDRFSFEAAIAASPGDATNSLTRLQASLTHDPARHRLTLRGDILFSDARLAETNGYWDYQLGLLDVQMGATGGSVLPLPRGRLVVNGPDCSIIGSSTIEILGVKLTDARAGYLMGGICTRGKDTADPAIREITDQMRDCGERGNVGLICLKGEATLGKDIAAAVGQFTTPLDRLRPSVRAEFGLLGDKIKVKTNVNTHRARVNAKIFKLMDVSLVLPTLIGVDKDLLESLFKNLLKPSIDIDLESLWKRKFKINPLSRHGKDGEGGEEAGDEAADGDEDPMGAASETTAQQAGEPKALAATEPQLPKAAPEKPPAPPRPAQNAPAGTKYSKPPGPFEHFAKPEAGTELWRVWQKLPGQPETAASAAYGGLYFLSDDAKNLADGGPLFFLAGQEGGRLDDGREFRIACETYPCDPGKLTIIGVSSGPDTRSNDLLPRTSLNLISGPFAILFSLPSEGPERVPFAGLVTRLAKQRLSDPSANPRWFCIRPPSKQCYEAFLEDKGALEGTTRAPTWLRAFRSSYSQDVLSDSLGERLIKDLCPSTDPCPSSAGDKLSTWDFTRIIATGASASGTIPTAILGIVWIPDYSWRVNLLIRIKSDWASLPVTIVPPMDRYLNSIYDTSVPAHGGSDALQALLDYLPQLFAKGIYSANSSTMKITANGSFAAALLESGKDMTVLSAVVSSSPSKSRACTRQLPFSKFTTPDEEWKFEIGEDALKELNKENGGEFLLRALVDPAAFLSEKSFRRLPISFFPPPAEACSGDQP
jgi:hypothetical protein